MNELRKAIFLDRDGVINRWDHPGDGAPSEKWYILSWDQFEFLPGALDALKMAKEELPQYDIFVVSNQSGIGKGLVDLLTIRCIFAMMQEEIGKAGGCIQDAIFCPHAPDAGCYCRKPRPGMLWHLAYGFQLDLENSWMIGDQASDMGAAEHAWIPTKQRIYVRTEYNEPVTTAIAQWNARDLTDALSFILQVEQDK